MDKTYTKYLTFSYDDAVKQDIRLVELFHKYNLKATFNLNSEMLGMERSYVVDGVRVDTSRVAPEDVKHIYAGHEVSAHTLTHPFLPDMEDDAEIIRQVEQDRLNLSDLVGYEVIGFAYPGGGQNFNDRIAKLIQANTGVKYARTIVNSHNFESQEDLYQLKPSVYHHREMDLMFEMGKTFLDLKTDRPQVFFVWGHAYEFDVRDDWKRFEGFLEMMSGRDDICYCTNREVLLNLR